MVDKCAEGAEGQPFTLRVERGKIAEFARAIGAQHADHTDPDTPVMSATFLTTMFHWERIVADSNPWHLVKMSKQRGMHASQRYVFHGPPPAAGAVLRAQSRIARIWDKTGRRGGQLTFVEMITEFRDEAGTLVAEALMTAVEPKRAAAEQSDAGTDSA
jgi:hypothetical protein